MDMATLEPALLEMLLGASAITDTGTVVGNWWPSQVSCSDAQQPNVAFEGWQDAWDDDHQAASPHQYIHWLWPSAFWQIGAHTLQNDFLQPRLTAFTRANPNWGLGIYGDQPEAAEPLGGFFYTSSIPAADCDYQSHTIT
jgi:hypothetical protein